MAISSLAAFHILIMVHHRQHLRRIFSMEHGTFRSLIQDFFTWACCGVCATIQEALQVGYVGDPVLNTPLQDDGTAPVPVHMLPWSLVTAPKRVLLTTIVLPRKAFWKSAPFKDTQWGTFLLNNRGTLPVVGLPTVVFPRLEDANGCHAWRGRRAGCGVKKKVSYWQIILQPMLTHTVAFLSCQVSTTEAALGSALRMKAQSFVNVFVVVTVGKIRWIFIVFSFRHSCSMFFIFLWFSWNKTMELPNNSTTLPWGWPWWSHRYLAALKQQRDVSTLGFLVNGPQKTSLCSSDSLANYRLPLDTLKESSHVLHLVMNAMWPTYCNPF